ncbi:MAG: AAA family ATPase [Sulfurospirillaceae bacterium]|nr:AAA family ATPase [Sulfurospirillaceae bacterium]MDD2826623.1 AAA family ATPase [Sulfurospirillaceae bacterium]
MIERLYVKNQLSFKACDIHFDKGLIVFTGPSGAGKSVLMQGLLSLFGYGEPMADVMECSIERELGLDGFGFEEANPNIFKYVKSKSARYFVNEQSISKKGMMELSRTFVNYLSVKDNSEFENEKLLTLLDGVCARSIPEHFNEVMHFEEIYLTYKKFKEELDELEKQEQKVEELKEFARFEIAKITEVSPKIGEDEELLAFKKSLSKKEKLEISLKNASAIFSAESYVQEVFALSDTSSAFFDECMNELRALFEKENEKLEALDEIDVEAMLDRIEKIAGLKKRYGSINETLEHLEKRRLELEKYENIAFEKGKLIKEVGRQFTHITESAHHISRRRKESLPLLEEKINDYLKQLYMPPISLAIEEGPLSGLGIDLLHVELGKVDLKKISSGEYNRVRLAFIATHNDFLQANGGILVLDEIDANLSGKESMSVANVLKQLSVKYQIFAISHQPQLSSMADMHFIVIKETNNESNVHLLDENARIKELARMISGENITEEAIDFAKSLLKSRDL